MIQFLLIALKIFRQMQMKILNNIYIYTI